MARGRYLTLDERKKIERLNNLGWRKVKIAKTLERAESAIFYEFSKNEKPYNAEKAQKRFNEAKKKQGTSSKLKEQIKNIENQLQIVFDILRELKNG